MKLICEQCNKIFIRRQSRHKRIFCSKQCSNIYKTKSKTECICMECGKQFLKPTRYFKVSKNNFCSKKCSGVYHSKHKKYGTSRSKLENYIQCQLTSIYPTLVILYNNKEIIKSELDIYIPSLKLAFELNGIFHYEPIFGDSKLKYIQNNDNRKFQACLENKIELCIIDTSQQRYFKVNTSKKYIEIICDIINLKLKSLHTELHRSPFTTNE